MAVLAWPVASIWPKHGGRSLFIGWVDAGRYSVGRRVGRERAVMNRV